MIKWLCSGWIVLFFSCGASDKRAENTFVLDPTGSVLSGEQLSQKYCQSCHLYPEPKALDKNTWERSVLPLMGRLFGIYEENVPRSEVIKGALNQNLVIEQNIFPEQQLLSDEEWAKIVDYYVSNAPDSAQFSFKTQKSYSSLEAFEVLKAYKGSDAISATLIKIDPDKALVYIGGSRGHLGFLKILNKDFETLDEIKLPTPPTDIRIGEDYLALTLAGSLVLMPSNNQFGEIIYLLRHPGEQKYSAYRKFVGDLSRPVNTVFEDLDGTGLEDIIVAEYGYYTGSLTLFKNIGDGRGLYKRTVLKNLPGAIKVVVEDMNQDGHKDIVALFAQGNENISIFYSDGQGNFMEESVLKFDPTYGSVYFELVDMNKDGFLDILYANGDNGDYPPILKDYHGIRIFENDGENNFEQVYFYPMHGVFKASAEDFDLDGHLDIFAISYFPDAQAKPRHDLVYLKSKGGYDFSPQLLEKDIPSRWITFDIEDLDGDGYKDVVLGSMGSFSQTPWPGAAVEANNSVVVLRNRGK